MNYILKVKFKENKGKIEDLKICAIKYEDIEQGWQDCPVELSVDNDTIAKLIEKNVKL
jgi:hypothetical protein